MSLFQSSPTDYRPRQESAPLEQMQQAAQALEDGKELPEPFTAALLRGTLIGGARPKVLLDDNGRNLIAKLSSTADPYPVVKAEAVGMELGRRVGLNVAGSRVIESLERDVLLVDRFDRTDVPGERRMMVSALTILGLEEMMAHPNRVQCLHRQHRRPCPQPRVVLGWESADVDPCL